MKINLLIIYSIFFVVLTSCTANDSDTSSDTSSDTNTNFNPNFELFVNGELYNSGNINNLYRFEDTFNVGYYPFTLLSFNKSGKFGFFSIVLPTSNVNIQRRYSSFRGFSSNYFNFNLENFDEVNKIVKFTFSGYIYADPLNLASEKKFVSGSFYQKYEELLPVVFGLKNKAKINGIDWLSTNKYYTRSPLDFNKVTQHDLSNDEYKIMVNYNLINTTIGTYNFTNTDSTNKIQLAKFDVQTGTFINYDCNGTLNVTNKYNNLFEGNYSFTAINPITNESISVTNGAFKLIYNNF